MSLKDYLHGGTFAKKTVFRYKPADVFLVGGSYLMKGMGKGQILSVLTIEGELTTKAGSSVPAGNVREFTVKFDDGRVIRAVPEKGVPLAGNKGVWVPRD
jgi:hypothetical protein